MTTTQVSILSIWLISGLFATLVLMRRGHRHWIWIVFGILLGPMAWLVFRERSEADAPHLEQLVQGSVGPGLHVLVGIDGSAAAERAAVTAVGLLGGQVGRMTLATVIDYDTDEDREDGAEPAAWEMLHAVKARQAPADPTEALLVGPPVDALLAFAAEHGVDLIVVGPRGSGLSERVMGSVCTGLVSRSPVPVLVVGGDPAAGPRP
ncbi:universal stress protein [Actinotalea sp.]|uniref:universal stress protein n=1 Tax=Actinotalea sp. TaxID=1872145 RepID=UPI003564A813